QTSGRVELDEERERTLTTSPIEGFVDVVGDRGIDGAVHRELRDERFARPRWLGGTCRRNRHRDPEAPHRLPGSIPSARITCWMSSHTRRLSPGLRKR